MDCNNHCKRCDKEHKKGMAQKHIKRKFFHLHTLIRFNGNANSLLLNHEYNNIKSKYKEMEHKKYYQQEKLFRFKVMLIWWLI